LLGYRDSCDGAIYELFGERFQIGGRRYRQDCDDDNRSNYYYVDIDFNFDFDHNVDFDNYDYDDRS
jgi:hypothetical protein